MLAKLCIVIMAITLTAASMLTVRQQRLEAVYDMARSIERAAGHDRQLQEVRIEVARRVTPQSVQALATRMGPFEPIPLEWCDPFMSVFSASTPQNPAAVSEASPMQIEAALAAEELERFGRTVLGPAFEMAGSGP